MPQAGNNPFYQPIYLKKKKNKKRADSFTIIRLGNSENYIIIVHVLLNIFHTYMMLLNINEDIISLEEGFCFHRHLFYTYK